MLSQTHGSAVTSRTELGTDPLPAKARSKGCARVNPYTGCPKGCSDTAIGHSRPSELAKARCLTNIGQGVARGDRQQRRVWLLK